MNIYESIATRTNGNIYIGVVGPVRTGKSTFITRFMEKMVIPNIDKNYDYKRTVDELPQSGDGRQIMTMEPRFVPSEAIDIKINNFLHASVRLVDCVGYLIDGVLGHEDENGNPRMVKTPWDENQIPFNKASEIGTTKVIKDHSTIGIVVTTDGTIANIPRENYVKSEARVINELRELNKPFVVLLNSLTPETENTQNLARAISEQYDVKVVVKNILSMECEDFNELLSDVLYEFPVNKIVYNLPKWLNCLEVDNDIVRQIIEEIKSVDVNKMKDYELVSKMFSGNKDIDCPKLNLLNMSNGEMNYKIDLSESLYYKAINEIAGTEILDQFDLLQFLKEARTAKINYDKIKTALTQAEETGYGIVMPTENDMFLETPEIVSKSGLNNLKLRANAPSLHIMKVGVNVEVTPPNIGGFSPDIEQKDDENIWETSVFGKKLSSIAYETMISKLSMFPKEAETKLVKTVTKITNENRGGIICVLL